MSSWFDSSTMYFSATSYLSALSHGLAQHKPDQNKGVERNLRSFVGHGLRTVYRWRESP